MSEDLYSIAQISRIIGIPESTCRYYRNHFSEYLPTTGKGRRKKYNSQAIDILRFIADHLRNGSSLTEVAELLKQKFPKFIDVATTKTTIAQVDNQTSIKSDNSQGNHLLADIAILKPLLQELTFALTVISNHKQEINDIKQQVQQLQQERDTIREYEKILTKKNKAIEGVRMENVSLRETVAEKQRQIVSLREEIHAEHEEVEKLRFEIEKVEELQSEVERLKKRKWWRRIFYKCDIPVKYR